MIYKTLTGVQEKEIIGASPAMAQLKERLPVLVALKRPILIQGESGTGKTLLAKFLLRQILNHKTGHVVIINGKQMGRFNNEDVLYHLILSLIQHRVVPEESLMFLDSSDIVDYFQVQSDKTSEEKIIFLFEDIDMFPDTSQRICLNIFSQGLHLEKVQVIATMAVKDWWSSIRSDLYYQLKGLVLHVPPLRERRSDIPDIARYFLKEVANGHPSISIHPSAMARLQQYYWPGNVEELRREIVAAKRRCGGGDIINVQHFSPNIMAYHQFKSTGEGLVIPSKHIMAAANYIQLGMTAYHVIHELKNPLTGILGSVDFFIEMNKTPSLSDLIKLRDQALRMRHLLSAFLGFRQSDFDTTVKATLDEVFSGTMLHLQNTLDVNIEEHVLISGNVPPNQIFGYIRYLKFVFVNLIRNAHQIFSYEKRDFCVEIRYTAEKNFLYITVADNGPGIPEKDLDKIFEPFFSTKEHGAGSGIGLTSCRYLIEAAGGVITACNRPEGGALFEIKIPL